VRTLLAVAAGVQVTTWRTDLAGVSVAYLLQCRMNEFASRFGSNDWVRFSQIRERRSRASYRDPPDRAVFGSGCRV
jgi:hypothetical protein